MIKVNCFQLFLLKGMQILRCSSFLPYSSLNEVFEHISDRNADIGTSSENFLTKSNGLFQVSFPRILNERS